MLSGGGYNDFNKHEFVITNLIGIRRKINTVSFIKYTFLAVEFGVFYGQIQKNNRFVRIIAEKFTAKI